MARFITVEVGCDWADCGTRAPEGDPEISAVELSIDRKQGREFLLCTKHRETFDEIVLPLMAAGVKVEIPASGRHDIGRGVTMRRHRHRRRPSTAGSPTATVTVRPAARTTPVSPSTS